MRGPLEVRISELLSKIENAGKVPLGILSFDIDREQLYLQLFPGVDRELANALLEKLGIVGLFD